VLSLLTGSTIEALVSAADRISRTLLLLSLQSSRSVIETRRLFDRDRNVDCQFRLPTDSSVIFRLA
jgi:hypothetical protein